MALLIGSAVAVSASEAPAVGQAGAPVTGRFPSPDGRLVATIAAGQERRPGGAQVLVATAAGRPLLRADYASGGSTQRLDVLQARWTPDSAFFVFSATSADGHQPWRFPVLFYSRAANQVRGLEAFSGGLSVVDPAFKIVAPDIVEVVGQKAIGGPREIRRFRLGALPSKPAPRRPQS